MSATAGIRFWAAASFALARRPRLWPTAVVQAGRLARPHWWRRPPFAPVPEREYLTHRLETQYGSDHDPESHDVVAYLEWCRHMSLLTSRRRKLRLRRGAPR